MQLKLATPLRRALSSVRRHAAILALGLVLLWIGGQSLGRFLRRDVLNSDDYKWVFRAVENSEHPWRVFSPESRLFGQYYRPIPHLVWVLNYYVWGFEFRGYHLTLVLMWLASVGFIYGIGLRLDGRLAGFVAAAAFGLNRIFLLVSTWKAWFTTVTELVLVLACVWVWLTALRNRSRRWFVAAAVLGPLAVMSRELAPLVLSAVVFTSLVEPPIRSHRWTRGRAGWVGLWAVVTLLVLIALPSYREALQTLVLRPLGLVSGSESGGGGSFSPATIETNLRAHLTNLYRAGFLPALVLFAAIAHYLRIRHVEEKLGGRIHTIFLGAFLVLAVLVKAGSLLYGGAFYLAQAILGREIRVIEFPTEFIEHAAVTLLWVWVATRGRKDSRMLGAWFAAAFVPLLFLQLHSGAYYLLAFSAMALYVGTALAEEIRKQLLPDLRVALRRAPEPPNWLPRVLRSLLLVVLLGFQAWGLGRNVVTVMPDIWDRATTGARERASVYAALRTTRQAFHSRRAYVFPEERARLVGLILEKRHGFDVTVAENEGLVAPFRRAYIPLAVYEGARPLRGLLGTNWIPNAGFEGELPKGSLVGPGYRSPRSLVIRLSPQVEENTQSRGLYLRPPAAGIYAFGAVVRKGPNARWVKVTLRCDAPSGSQTYKAHERPLADGWSQHVDCVPIPAGAQKLHFEVVVKRHRDHLAALAWVDEVFLVPVGMR